MTNQSQSHAQAGSLRVFHFSYIENRAKTAKKRPLLLSQKGDEGSVIEFRCFWLNDHRFVDSIQAGIPA
jgi:hypothetical protein